ncbi:hypothetical protein Trydic_g13432 [Trypoxylus dichotomus]
MYPNLSRLSLHGSERNIARIEGGDYEHVKYPTLTISLPELRQIIRQNVGDYEPKQFKLIDKFLQDEEEYVDKLAVLEIQKFDLGTVQIPHYDLQTLFGYVEDIKHLHEDVLPRNFLQAYRVEDILTILMNHEILYHDLSVRVGGVEEHGKWKKLVRSHKFRIYIKDQWKKSQVKFSGKQALLKRFYNQGVVKDLSAPEQKISDYLKFHEQLKSNCEHLKSSEVFQQSFQLFNNIYIQMQYVKQAALVDKFPMPHFHNIHLVNLFNVNIDNGLPIRYKVYLLDNCIVFTSVGGPNQISKVELSIRTDTISLNASTPKEEPNFEMYEHYEKNQKRVYVFLADNHYIRDEWVQVINKVLYRQMVVVRQRVKSNSDESTHSVS